MTAFILQSVLQRTPSYSSGISTPSPTQTIKPEHEPKLRSSHGVVLPQGECAFCDIISGFTKAWIVYEDEDVMAILDIFPMRLGHTLLIPKSHHPRLSDLSSSLGSKMGSALPKVTKAVVEATGNKDINVVCNQGYAQEVHHVHWHLIPAPVFPALNGEGVTPHSLASLPEPIPHPHPTQPTQGKDTNIDGHAIPIPINGNSNSNGHAHANPSISSTIEAKPKNWYSPDPTPPTHSWMWAREMANREELDEQEAEVLKQRIRKRISKL